MWKVLSKVPGADIVHEIHIDAMGDKYLRYFVQKKGSHLEVLGMKKYEGAEFGMMGTASMDILDKETFFRLKGHACGIVSSVLKALQASHRIGGFTNLQSVSFPVTPTTELDILSGNVEFGRKELVEEKGRRSLSGTGIPQRRRGRCESFWGGCNRHRDPKGQADSSPRMEQINVDTGKNRTGEDYRGFQKE